MTNRLDGYADGGEPYTKEELAIIDDDGQCIQCQSPMTKLEIIVLGLVCGKCVRKNHKKAMRR